MTTTTMSRRAIRPKELLGTLTSSKKEDLGATQTRRVVVDALFELCIAPSSSCGPAHMYSREQKSVEPASEWRPRWLYERLVSLYGRVFERWRGDFHRGGGLTNTMVVCEVDRTVGKGASVMERLAASLEDGRGSNAAARARNPPLWSLSVDRTKMVATVEARRGARPLVSELCQRRGDNALVFAAQEKRANAAGVLCGLVAGNALGSSRSRAARNAVAIVEAGAVEPLVELLLLPENSETRGAMHAARALSDLVWVAWGAIVEAGAVEPLVELLRSGDAGGKREAARALLHLTMVTAAYEKASEKNVLSYLRLGLVEAGAHDSLVKLVRSGDTAAKRIAAYLLWYLAFEHSVDVDPGGGAVIDSIETFVEFSRRPRDDGRFYSAQAGPFGQLVELLRGGLVGGTKKAAGALQTLAVNVSNKVAIAMARGSGHLAKLLRSAPGALLNFLVAFDEAYILPNPLLIGKKSNCRWEQRTPIKRRRETPRVCAHEKKPRASFDPPGRCWFNNKRAHP
jgi:hypothetical protein